MRVISGSAKGRRLKRVPGAMTRPIMDRVKENLFNILADEVAGSRWLDLFAGTGQVGIEALSRGATSVVFVDNARPAVRTIEDNLTHTGLRRGAEVTLTDAFLYLRRFRGQPFDVIYVAPPQYKDLWMETLRQIDGQPETYLAPGGLVAVQIDPKEFREMALQRLSLFDQRRYGSTMLLFFDASQEGET